MAKKKNKSFEAAGKRAFFSSSQSKEVDKTEEENNLKAQSSEKIDSNKSRINTEEKKIEQTGIKIKKKYDVSENNIKKEKKTERIQLLISKTLDNKLKEAAANSK